MANSGDRCKQSGCPGRLHVYATTHKGDYQTQYLECAVCRDKPSGNKVVKPAASIRRRYLTK